MLAARLLGGGGDEHIRRRPSLPRLRAPRDHPAFARPNFSGRPVGCGHMGRPSDEGRIGRATQTHMQAEARDVATVSAPTSCDQRLAQLYLQRSVLPRSAFDCATERSRGCAGLALGCMRRLTWRFGQAIGICEECAPFATKPRHARLFCLIVLSAVVARLMHVVWGTKCSHQHPRVQSGLGSVACALPRARQSDASCYPALSLSLCAMCGGQIRTHTQVVSVPTGGGDARCRRPTEAVLRFEAPRAVGQAVFPPTTPGVARTWGGRTAPPTPTRSVSLSAARSGGS